MFSDLGGPQVAEATESKTTNEGRRTCQQRTAPSTSVPRAGRTIFIYVPFIFQTKGVFSLGPAFFCAFTPTGFRPTESFFHLYPLQTWESLLSWPFIHSKDFICRHSPSDLDYRNEQIKKDTVLAFKELSFFYIDQEVSDKMLCIIVTYNYYT